MISKESKRGSICSLAKSAKERLKNNNYTRDFKSTTIDNATSFAKYIYEHRDVCCKKREDYKRSISYDDDLYKRVCELIETNCTQNPILSLIDKDLFSSLDTEAKQFYLNNLTQKYKFLRNRYYKEHAFSFV